MHESARRGTGLEGDGRDYTDNYKFEKPAKEW